MRVLAVFWLNHIGRNCGMSNRGRVCTARAQCAHDGKKLGVLLQLAIFLPIQTILHPHNVGQPDVSWFSSGMEREGNVGPSFTDAWASCSRSC